MASPEDKVMSMLPQIGKAVVNSISEITDIICKLLEEKKDDKVAKDILGYAKDGGNINFVSFDGIVGQDFKRALALANVKFVEAAANGAAKGILFIKECDVLLVNQIKREILINKGKINEMTLTEMLNRNYGKKLEVVKGIDDVTMARLRTRAKESNIIFAAEKNNEGKNNIYFAPEDKKLMNYALFRAAWDLNGKVGEKNKERIQYDLDKKKSFLDSLDKKEEKYIVSVTNSKDYIVISEKGIDVYENNKLIDSKERISDDFSVYAAYQYDNLRNPVELSKEDFFSPYMKDKIKEVNKRPIISQDTKELWKREESLRGLVEKKLSLDNGYQVENVSSLYNGEVSLREFFEHELVNHDHDREELDRIFENFKEEEIKVYIEQIQSTLETQISYNFETISVDVKSIDTIVNEFEAQKESKEEKTTEDRGR